jgi:hypothetical protein
MVQKFGDNVLTSLEQSISSAAFRERLQQSRQCVSSSSGGGTGTEELDALLGEYVVVTKQDAIDAMAAYLAAMLANIPEAQGMDPAKLQEALVVTVRVSSRFFAYDAQTHMLPLLSLFTAGNDSICTAPRPCHWFKEQMLSTSYAAGSEAHAPEAAICVREICIPRSWCVFAVWAPIPPHAVPWCGECAVELQDGRH